MADLYALDSPLPEPGTAGTVLVHAFDGFVDAGSGATLATQHLLAASGGQAEVVARFDVDTLVDYRSRRPRMAYLGDHFESVDLPELVVHRLRDDHDRPYYLLTGPEPDLRWEAFTAAVQELVESLGVTTAVGLTAVPWPTPHTRRLPVSAHASDPAKVAGSPSWVGKVDVPGHVGAFLELRLGQTGLDSRGLTVHVPHYLATSELPRAALTLLEHLVQAVDLALPLTRLALAAAETDAKVARELAESPESSEALAALERQYDGMVASMPSGTAGLVPARAVPSADEIGAQVEQFLADLGPDDAAEDSPRGG